MSFVTAASVFTLLVVAGAPNVPATDAVSHTPPASFVVGEDLTLTLKIEKGADIRRARVRFRFGKETAFDKADFPAVGEKRDAVIPGALVTSQVVEYFIVVQTGDGAVVPVAGSPSDPIRVSNKGNAGEPPSTSKGADTKNKDADAKASDTKDTKDTGENNAANSPSTTTPVGEKSAPDPESGAAATTGKESNGNDPSTTGKGAKPAPTSGAPSSKDGKNDAAVKKDSSSTTDKDPSAGDAATSVDGQKQASRADVVETGPRVKPRRLRGGRFNEKSSGDDLVDELSVFAAVDRRGFPETPLPAATYASTSRLSRDDIVRLPVRNLGEIIRLLPGVDVTRTILGYDVVTIRGLRGDARTNVVVDGMPFGNGHDGRVPWFLPVTLIESVEVGLASAVDEDGSRLGGAVIKVTTLRRSGVNAEAWGQSLLGGGVAVVGGWDFGVVSLGGGAHLEGEIGPRLDVEEDRYSNSAFERSPDDMVTKSEKVRGAAMAHVEVPIGSVTLDAQALSAGEWRGPYIGYFDTLGESSTLTWADTTASVGAKAHVARFLELGARAGVSHDYIDQSLQLTPADFRTPDVDQNGEDEVFADGVLVRRAYSRFEVFSQGFVRVRAFRGNALSTGVALSFGLVPPGGFLVESNRALGGSVQGLGIVDGVTPENGPCDFYTTEIPVGACRATAEAYVRDEQSIFGVVDVAMGLRAVGFSDVGFDPATQLLPHAGLRLRVLDGLVMFSSAMAGVRAPTQEERLDATPLLIADLSRGVFLGNDALRAESFRTVDAGIESAINTLGADTTLRFSLFGTGVEDAIESLPVNGILEKIQNAGGDTRDFTGMLIVGAEGSGVVKFGASRVFANASWFRSTWRARNDLDADEPICAIAPGWGLPVDDAAAPTCSLVTEATQFRGNLGAIVDVDPIGSVSAVVTLGSERRNNARTTLERLRAYTIPAYGVFSLGFRSRPLFGVVGAYGQVTNLLDASVKDDTPRPDRMRGLVPREGTSGLVGLYLTL